MKRSEIYLRPVELPANEYERVALLEGIIEINDQVIAKYAEIEMLLSEREKLNNKYQKLKQVV